MKSGLGQMTTDYISGFSGNATNSLKTHHDNMQFSVRDYDDYNTIYKYSCSDGGWWFGSFCRTNLNGHYSNIHPLGIRWFHDDTEEQISMRFTEMKIRMRV